MVCAATAMLMLDIAVVNTALSAIAADLDTGLSGLQWVVDAYTLALAATVITAGSLADRFGRRRLFGIGLGVFIATSLLCAAAQSITMLNASRAAQGVGAAIMFAVSLAVLSNAFPRTEERVKALAAYGATMGGSFAVGPLVGGALTSGLDWRWIFLINLPLGLACLWIVRRHVAESMDPRAPRVDRPGLVTLTGGLFLLVLRAAARQRGGLGEPDDPRLPSPAPPRCCARSSPSRRASRSPCSRCACSATRRSPARRSGAFGISASLFAMWLYMTLYLQQILGLSAIEAGLVYLPGTMLNFFVAGATASVGQKVSPRVLVAGGPGADRRRPGAAHDRRRRTRRGGCSCPACSSRWSARACSTRRVSQVALSSAPPEQSGLAAGVNDMFRQAGIAVGVAALGALVPAGAALGDGSPQSYVDGLHDALWVGAVLALAAAAATALLIRGPRREQAGIAGDVAFETT